MKWIQLKNASLDLVTAWAALQPWCKAMAECAQDGEWHSEGDVWTHTKLVMDQLTRLEEWSQLSPHEQTVLVFTALLHDSAKPFTTEVDEAGRVRSPRHAEKGEQIARNVLRELDCELSTREEIARLVRYHGRPAFLLERDQPTHEVVRLSWLVNNRLLYLFALADTRGRVTCATSRPEEHLHFWKSTAEELGCYNQAYRFATDHARFTFFRHHEPNLYYVPHENFTCNATLLAGAPGSGKDKWLSQNRPDLPTVSLDDIRGELGIDPTDNQGQVAQAALERCRDYLRAGESFALNATNTMRSTRARWLNLFADYNAQLEVVYLEPPIDRLLMQNKTRSKAAPESVVRRLVERCEPPTWLECHQLHYFDRVE